ncbi:MAG: restriction endonuclease subunit S [Gallionellales bacterium RIFCSPLOWO2_02_FULL_57_47]|nr:MAG: restriction endonuclease subunit S [Gallionellales bacterium RIFCSPLOWO2_02_FULL_57_47]OGT16293.1 MAG: restriction endonuclease subunit S [Gallionellales bacterium RIFCSPHIGHO2_02_FULL_57_16]
MSLPRYPDYKDSGVEWLGEVPGHWGVKSIKWLSPVQRGASPRPIDDPKYFDDEGEYAWVRIADVSASDGELSETTQRLSELGSSLSVKINPGELFISIAGTVGKPCISAIKACIHDGFVYFPMLNIPPIFLYRIFEAGVCYGGLGKFGTQLNLNTDTIGSIRIALPPDDELQDVLSFLDRETGKIDALIAEQRRLVELLAEKRQAVISHAVTKGLNPNARMKDSGIEWLGDVPEHWEVRKMKHLATRIASGKTPLGGSEIYVDEGVMFLRSQNVYDEGLRLEDVAYISEAIDEVMSVSSVRPNDILLNVTGASIGRSCVVPSEFPAANVNQHVCVIRLRTLAQVPFVGLFFKSMPVKNQIAHAQNGAAREGLNFDQIGNMSIAMPPSNEQKSITAFLDIETAKFDTLTAEAHRAIELLRERRSALISAAVTGKIDVRKAA